MSTSEERETERRHMLLLAPLMIAANAIVLLCMVGLCILTLNGGQNLGILPGGGDASHQIVEEYLAQRLPFDAYRIREWYPPQPATDQGVAQRVTLVHYGSKGARQMDTTFWIRDGAVTRVVQTDCGRFADCL